MGCVGDSAFDPEIVGMGESGNPADSPFLWNVIPQSLAVLRHLAADFKLLW